MRVGRIPYVNCYPVYGAIDAGEVALDAELVSGVPTALNRMMRAGELDVSVVSAVEYARATRQYVLLPDLAISCRGPVRSVMLFSSRPAHELDGERVVVSRSSMTSVALLELLFRHVWFATPRFEAGDAEPQDASRLDAAAHLVIGDAALIQRAAMEAGTTSYSHAYDLGEEWYRWTGLPFVFAVWVAQASTPLPLAQGVHRALLQSRAWGLRHLPALVERAHQHTGVAPRVCDEYLRGLDYALTPAHLAGLEEFFRRVHADGGGGEVGRLAFLPAA